MSPASTNARSQIGFSVLAAVPEANIVYPLLGRPQDSLPESGDR